MTIDETILHCEEVINNNMKKYNSCPYHPTPCDGTIERCCIYTGKFGAGCIKCISEHRQLAEWLKELKEWRKMYDDCLANNDDCPLVATAIGRLFGDIREKYNDNR